MQKDPDLDDAEAQAVRIVLKSARQESSPRTARMLSRFNAWTDEEGQSLAELLRKNKARRFVRAPRAAGRAPGALGGGRSSSHRHGVSQRPRPALELGARRR